MELHSGPDLYGDLGATESKIICHYCHYFRELGLMISGKVKLLLDCICMMLMMILVRSNHHYNDLMSVICRQAI